ncbi:hypothetical protein TNCT_455381 [Trichonephila clavata]|uniref:Uncharacterized protein n=1 Tax=Trichonephila clavata TaxID=2740835 RepID=A0A8X6FR19_TRICU|nr:hypothetical protein TNCT_455381 [Trichonephila clavata]
MELSLCRRDKFHSCFEEMSFDVVSFNSVKEMKGVLDREGWLSVNGMTREGKRILVPFLLHDHQPIKGTPLKFRYYWCYLPQGSVSLICSVSEIHGKEFAIYNSCDVARFVFSLI